VRLLHFCDSDLLLSFDPEESWLIFGWFNVSEATVDATFEDFDVVIEVTKELI
jgi:hypothetical protein